MPSEMFYIGRHTGTEDDGYICSSELVRPLIEARPKEWQREILETGTFEQMEIAEILHLKRCNAVDNPMCLNQTNGKGKIVFKQPPYTVRSRISIRKLLEQ